MKRRELMLAATSLCLPALSAHAQAPTRATAFVPFPPGGPLDVLTRSIAEAVTQQTGRIVVVDNRPGGGGQIAGVAAKKPPEGAISLFVGDWAILGSNVALYKKFAYDPLRDFVPVTILGSFPMVLYVNSSNPAKSVADLLEQARKGKTLTYASQGPGTAGHVLGAMFQAHSKSTMQHVPYRGSAPAVQDLLAGNVDLLFDAVPAGHQYVSSGKLRALAIMADGGSPLLPGVPTAAAAGMPDLNMSVWFGLVANSATPPAVVSELYKEFSSALASDKVTARFKAQGFSFTNMTPDQFGVFMRSESERWSGVIKANNIVVD